MTPLPRALLPAAALAATTLFAAGCTSASSTSGSTSQSSAPPAVPSSPASGAASAAAPSTAVAPAAVRSASATAVPGPVIYLAESASLTGPAVRVPSCQAGCQLSGDGTTSLWNMTWSAWNSTEAVGTGTEKIDDCDPDCAAGTLHSVTVIVTFGKPVMVCVSGTGRWYWTSASFTWPRGLPTALTGDNAPLNPFTYPGIAAEAATSCP